MGEARSNEYRRLNTCTLWYCPMSTRKYSTIRVRRFSHHYQFVDTEEQAVVKLFISGDGRVDREST